MKDPVFIIGAGFGVDANETLKPTETDVGYPLVSDLWSLCFPDKKPSKSIEEEFQKAIDCGDNGPIEKLACWICRTDYWLTKKLIKQPSNYYFKFLSRFPNSNFLTFNYDSLLEILLFNRGRWSPKDGFGFPVHVELDFSSHKETGNPRSEQKVVHLHGAFTVFAEEAIASPLALGNTIQLTGRESPVYHFDPDRITNCFPGVARVQPTLGGYQFLHERVIAPVPDKAPGLTGDFIRRSYEVAIEKICCAKRVVAVGYSFNEHDRASFERLLCNSSAEFIVVSPSANEICIRMRRSNPRLKWLPIEREFGKWAKEGFNLGV
jgi:hypothetical protein